MSRALRFAEDLGPASSVHVRTAGRRELERRLLLNDSEEDAVLGTVHAGIRDSSLLLEEFVSHFKEDLRRLIFGATSGRRIHLATESDFQQELVTAIWTYADEFEFRTTPSFLAWIKQRMAFMRDSRVRKQRAAKRNHEKQVAITEAHQPEAQERSPLSVEASREELALTYARMLELPDRERRALGYHLNGLKVGQIAEAMGCSTRTVNNYLANGRMRLSLEPPGAR